MNSDTIICGFLMETEEQYIRRRLTETEKVVHITTISRYEQNSNVVM